MKKNLFLFIFLLTFIWVPFASAGGGIDVDVASKSISQSLSSSDQNQKQFMINAPTTNNTLVNAPETSLSATSSIGNISPTTTSEVNINSKSTVIDPRELPNATSIFPHYALPIPGQGVNRITKALPKFFGFKALSENEEIIDAISFNGWAFDRIRIEDLYSDVIKYIKKAIESKKWPKDKVRYDIFSQDQTKAMGTGGGANMSSNTLNGATGLAGTGAILPAYNTSFADPRYIVWVVLVKEGEVKKSEVSPSEPLEKTSKLEGSGMSSFIAMSSTPPFIIPGF